MHGHIMQEKILDKGWSVLHNPPYSADIAPSDFHLYCFLKNAPNKKKISPEGQEKTFVENFLISKPAEFYLRGINKQSDE